MDESNDRAWHKTRTSAGRRVWPGLLVLAMLATSADAVAKPAAKNARSIIYGRVGVGLGAGQDFVPTKLDPLLGFSAFTGGGFAINKRFAIEVLIEGLVSRDVVAPSYEGVLVQSGFHGALMSVAPNTKGMVFGLVGGGVAVVANNTNTRLGGTGVIGIGLQAPDKVDLPFGAAAFYAPRIAASPIGFVHSLHVNAFMKFTIL